LAKGLPSNKAKYEGYQVFRITPETEEQLAVLREWGNDPHFDFWEETDKLGRHATVMVPPKQLGKLQSTLAKFSIQAHVVNENVQRSVDAERAEIEQITKTSGKRFEYNTFNRYESIIDELEEMKRRCPEGFTCETYDIGMSTEDRALRVFKISAIGGGQRQGVWMDSLIHAREWIAGSTVLKIMDNFLSNYGTDRDTTYMLDTYDWYFLPVMNPDGYINSWDEFRLWRKNMRPPHPDDWINQCYGVDLNRNYDIYWMNDGTTDIPCLDNYGGPGPASEPETVAVQAEAMRLGNDLIAWVSVHSFSYLWLTPWGNTDDDWECDIPADYEDMMNVTRATAVATGRTHGSGPWEYGSCCTVLYAASGSTMDYVKARAGVKYTFTPELRGDNFIISPAEVHPSFEEIWNGVKAMVYQIEAVEGSK